LLLVAGGSAVAGVAIAGAAPTHAATIAIILGRASCLQGAVESSVAFVALAAPVVARSKARAGKAVFSLGAFSQQGAVTTVVAALAVALAVHAFAFARAEIRASIRCKLHTAIWATQSRRAVALSMKTEADIGAVFGAARHLSAVLIGEAWVAEALAEFADTVPSANLTI